MAADISFEFCFQESIITCEAYLLLAIADLETDICHGAVDIKRVLPLENDIKVNKKKRAANNRSSVFKKKVF